MRIGELRLVKVNERGNCLVIVHIAKPIRECKFLFAGKYFVGDGINPLLFELNMLAIEPHQLAAGGNEIRIFLRVSRMSRAKGSRIMRCRAKDGPIVDERRGFSSKHFVPLDEEANGRVWLLEAHVRHTGGDGGEENLVLIAFVARCIDGKKMEQRFPFGMRRKTLENSVSLGVIEHTA